jgi:hypothetical protein
MSKDIKTADAQTKTLGKSLRGLMRVLWPLMAIEFAINLFGNDEAAKYTDIAQAAKDFAEAQTKVNKEIKESNFLWGAWHNILLGIERVLGVIKKSIGEYIEFSKMDFSDMAKTFAIEGLQLVGIKEQGSSPLDKRLAEQAREAKYWAGKVTGGTPIVNHNYTIDGTDTGLVEKIIKNSVGDIMTDYTQSMYSGGN